MTPVAPWSEIDPPPPKELIPPCEFKVTVRELHENRALANRRCLIWHCDGCGKGKPGWFSVGCGYVAVRDQAGIYTAMEVIKTYCKDPVNSCMIEILEEKPMTCPKCGQPQRRQWVKVGKKPAGIYCTNKECGAYEPLPRAKLCEIEKVLPRHYLELIKHEPLNPQFRSQVLARLKHPIPDECTTYASIKEWVEFTISATPPRQIPEHFQQMMSVSEIETGTCRYRVKKTGAGYIRLDTEWILEKAQGCEDWEEFTSAVREKFEDLSHDNIQAEWDWGGADIGDCDDVNSEGFDARMPASWVESLAQFLANVDAYEYQRLTNAAQ